MQWVRKVINARATYYIARAVGLILLAWYWWSERDLRFSFVGMSMYIVIAVLVSFAIVKLRLGERFPKLDAHLFSRYASVSSSPQQDWAAEKADHLRAGFRRGQIVFTFAEDGLICVPLLLAGVTPLNASIGGIAFGALHLGRFTYLECIGKGIIYALSCLLILPTGLLSLMAGHFAMDALGWLVLTVHARSRSRRNVSG